MNGPARAVSYGIGSLVGVVNVLTDQPYAAKRLIPFRRHGQMEAPLLPLLVALPFRTRGPARLFYLAYMMAGLSNFFFTDYKAAERPVPTNGVPLRPSELIPVGD